MNLAVLLALKMVHDQNQANARRHRRAREEARKKQKAPNNSSSSYSSKQYSETEYFNLVVTEDPILTTFFKELEKKGQEIDDLDAEEVRKTVEEKLKNQAQRVEKIQKSFEDIRKSGLDLTKADTYFAYRTTVGEKVLESGSPAFGNKGEYASVKKSFELEYKGISLAREWFKGDRKKENPFEVRYNKWFEENKDLETNIEAKKEEIRIQERKVKFALFGKEEKEEELERLKSKLQRLEEEKARGEAIRKSKETFAEITPEQKDMIEKYFEIVDECKEAGQEVDADIQKYNQIKEVNYHYSYNRDKSEAQRNKWQRAMDSLMADGEVSEELLDAIDTIISEENIGYKSYSEGKDKYEMQREGFSERFSNVVEWYLETRREKIAEKALHRKEEAYKILAQEHKKLCEMAGLVDKAEELEEGKVKKGDDGHGEHDE